MWQPFLSPARVFLYPLISLPFLRLVICLWKSKFSRISLDRCQSIGVEIRESSCSRDIIPRLLGVIVYSFLYQIKLTSILLKHLGIKVVFLNLMLYSDSEYLKFLSTYNLISSSENTCVGMCRHVSMCCHYFGFKVRKLGYRIVQSVKFRKQAHANVVRTWTANK